MSRLFFDYLIFFFSDACIFRLRLWRMSRRSLRHRNHSLTLFWRIFSLLKVLITLFLNIKACSITLKYLSIFSFAFFLFESHVITAKEVNVFFESWRLRSPMFFSLNLRNMRRTANFIWSRILPAAFRSAYLVVIFLKTLRNITCVTWAFILDP